MTCEILDSETAFRGFDPTGLILLLIALVILALWTTT
jgi:hypothetical protein